MAQSKINQDLHVNGTLSAKAFTPPAGSITAAAIAGNTGIDADDLEHRYYGTYADESGAATATEARVLHVARFAGTINDFRAGHVSVCAGAATVVVDLLVNGSSVLTGTFTLDNANTNRVAEAGTINTPAYSAGDVIEASWTATAGGGTLGDGFFCQVEVDEAAS